MELIDLLKNENAKELFESKDCKIHTYGEENLVKYPHGCTLDDGEGGWLKYCRGAVYSGDKVLVVPPLRFKEGKPDDYQEIQEYIDGTMINVWYNGEKWNVSTRSRIGALCSWHSKKTFRKMFFEIMNENNGSFDILDKTKGYSFVMVHTENRIVQKYNGNKLYLVSMWDTETNSYCDTREPYSKLKEEYVPWYKLPKILENDTDLTSENIGDTVGYVYLNGNDRYKQMHPKYLELKQMAHNSHLVIYNYIENRRNGKLPEFLKYYPEKRRECNHFKNYIHDFTQMLYDLYNIVFKEKHIKLNKLPYVVKPLLYELHGMYLQTRTPIGFSTVMGYINDLPTARLVFVLLRFKKDKGEFIEQDKTDKIISNTVSEIMDSIENESESSDSGDEKTEEKTEESIEKP